MSRTISALQEVRALPSLERGYRMSIASRAEEQALFNTRNGKRLTPGAIDALVSKSQQLVASIASGLRFPSFSSR